MKIILCTALMLLLVPTFALAKLEFDSKKNNAQLFGPYIKYNVLKPPFSFGRYQFEKTDIALELRGTSLPQGDEALNDDMEEEQKGQVLYAVWPKFLLEFGTITITTEDGKALLDEDFDSDDVRGDDKYVHYKIQDQDANLIASLGQNFRICVIQDYKETYVEACSDYMRMDGKRFVATKTSQEDQKVQTTFNGQDVPKNAQITLPEGQQTMEINLEFKSGFKIHVKDEVRRLNLENVAIDPIEKRLGIIGGDGKVTSSSLTYKDRFFKFIKEKNYYRNQFEVSQQWPQNLEDAEMEFAPYPLGASAQHYGLILDQLPPKFEFSIDPESPIATYRSVVEIKGKKAKNEKLTAKRKDELMIHKDETSFVWRFPAPDKGAMNMNYLALKYKKNYYYFSRRIFRAHKGSVTAAAALSASPTLDVVPGYRLTADYWPESIWGDQKWAYQRWGFAFEIFETAQPFKPKKDFTEKVSINPIHFEIMYRFSPGIRPVQSSFGLSLRYLRYQLFRSISSDLTPRFLGVGAFWHTAPQKIVDDVFNIVPLFRYPKWMELSAFYYPMIFGDFNLGFSWSYHAKGRMFFARSWFLDASFNVMDMNFEVVNNVKPRISTAHGTIGIGMLF